MTMARAFGVAVVAIVTLVAAVYFMTGAGLFFDWSH